jgi:sugar/nucleoside kinase (ribokinase family)
MKLDVVSLGILVADVIAVPVERYPERGRLVLTERMTLNVGGCATNSAIGMARLGLKVAVIGKVGKDALGDFILSALEAEGVKTDGISRDEDAGTSSTMVMVHPDGERSFIHNIGANAKIREEELDLEFIGGAGLLHIGGALLMPGFDGAPLARTLARSKQMGMTTVLDTAWDGTGQWMNLLQEALPKVDYLLPSIEEAAMLTGESEPEKIAGRLLAEGVKVVALKRGGKGCYVGSQGEGFFVPPYRVEMVDSTGAGDAFVAGFVTGVVKGLGLRKCAEMGNAVGALCVTGLGTTGGLPRLDELEKFMRQTGKG